MTQTVDPVLSVDDLKTKIKKLNSKAGQMKMDLHDIAEGLPTDLEKLPVVAEQTYQIFCELADLRNQLKQLENRS
ncbi:MAG: CCE_0567 family metalloprotein [Synechococcales bacterium]|nr:CCE_0567 family metalloprotein [Synechococcales bacterium]